MRGVSTAGLQRTAQRRERGCKREGSSGYRVGVCVFPTASPRGGEVPKRVLGTVSRTKEPSRSLIGQSFWLKCSLFGTRADTGQYYLILCT